MVLALKRLPVDRPFSIFQSQFLEEEGDNVSCQLRSLFSLCDSQVCLPPTHAIFVFGEVVIFARLSKNIEMFMRNFVEVVGVAGPTSSPAARSLVLKLDDILLHDEASVQEFAKHPYVNWNEVLVLPRVSH